MTAAPLRHRWAALGVLAAALAMIILDGTIVGVAMPAISDDLDLHLTEAQWVNSLCSVGVWGSVMAGTAVIGPLLGGWLTTVASRRWNFYVNVPVGLAVLVVALLLVPETQGVKGGRGLDVDGLLTSGIGMAFVVFGMIEATALGWWRPKEDFIVLGLTWPATAPVSPVPVALAVGILFLLL